MSNPCLSFILQACNRDESGNGCRNLWGPWRNSCYINAKYDVHFHYITICKYISKPIAHPCQCLSGQSSAIGIFFSVNKSPLYITPWKHTFQPAIGEVILLCIFIFVCPITCLFCLMPGDRISGNPIIGDGEEFLAIDNGLYSMWVSCLLSFLFPFLNWAVWKRGPEMHLKDSFLKTLSWFTLVLKRRADGGSTSIHTTL